MQVLASPNLTLAFALELATLAAFAYFGFRVTDHAIIRWVLAIGLPVLLSLVLFLLAALALYRSGQPGLAVATGVSVVLHVALGFAWSQW
ncbi:DUF2568 domain-containing protein [Truepera radiovictrix]|uniref:DUF2568 domain-containing protein n=1 Tax=Truepera radiovictrix (strain DSM 17093 / CIP 108686 / LMG 22925 / RQ-24) TaxID=649638 RepID=D7CX47_TRURR|nr:DUF2568 domain-containing protein [Truepera radiovictrix]ADI14555.1 conserved hypothetical protein [Truepera radiovictrix DSM 17093]WMT56895.1 DUF2568 domain-containing protein [Truepera radiovictrix]